VGIPTYERPSYVVQAIESVLAQRFENWSLLVCEDGEGTRATREAVEPYFSDPRIRFRAAGRWVGLVGNKNLLIDAGTAPYLALLDDDDLWEPTFLSRRVSFLEEHSGCGFVFSPVSYMDASGEALGRSESFEGGGVLPRSEFLPALLRANMIRTPSVLMRRRALEAVGDRLDERFPVVNDWELWLRLAMRFDVGQLPGADARYRLHGPQMILNARIGDEALRLTRHADELLATIDPELRLSPEELKRLEGGWVVSTAVDAAEDGNVRAALSRLAEARRLSPRALADRRVAGILAGALLGQRGGRVVASLRRRTRTRRAEKAHRSAGSVIR
jgi:glycosyltransferase involved in cell wall biosynthesis